MPYWPDHLPRNHRPDATTLHGNLAAAAMHVPDSPALGFFGRETSWQEFAEGADRFAAWLQSVGIKAGDWVAIYMQNAPQWLVAFYGILRADAVVVPINPMLRASDLVFFLQDSGATLLVCAENLAENALAAASHIAGLRIVTACYADALPAASPFTVPDWVAAPSRVIAGCTAWAEAMACPLVPAPSQAQPNDLAILLYTSGSTGRPKGVLHSHASLMHSIAAISLWQGQSPASRILGMSPMYAMSGLANCVLCFVHARAMLVLVPRWDRALVAELICHYRIDYLPIAPTAIIDLLASPDLERYDLSSVRRVTAGGAPMPAEVWRRLDARLGLPFIEVYGMSEVGTLTMNPIERPKAQCLGVPIFDTDLRIVDPETLQPVAPGETGEIIAAGPQLALGYWQRPEDDAAAFVMLDGKRFYRTGDVGHVDDDGYVFMTDRIKRMINAAGFKVWPAEIETMLYQHPDVQEACVIAAADPYRGETVKALVVLRPERRGAVAEAEIIDWARARMAAYKYPRIVTFVEALPKSPVGKILWRELQDIERQAGAPEMSPSR
jgi:fatty-acyl-CoA synthase